MSSSAFANYQNVQKPLEEEPAKVLETNDRFIQRALELASQEFNDRFESSNVNTKSNEFYVVWFAKTLGNWKALVSTDLISGLYWEITHNGAKQETYVDAYVKLNNRAVPDGSLS